MSESFLSLEGFQKGLQTARQILSQRIDYKAQFIQLGSIYLFKIFFQNALSKCPFMAIKKFAIECYRLIFYKTVYEYLIEKYQWENDENKKQYKKMIKVTEKYSARVSPNLGKEYCELLSKIEDKKCITMEFILFLLCLGSQKIMLKLTAHEDIQKILTDKKFIQKLQLQKISCIIINYEITNLKIQDTVYNELFNRYIKGKKVNPNKNTVSATSSAKKLSIAKNTSQTDIKRSHRKHLKGRKMVQSLLSPQIQELKKQIGAILWNKQQSKKKINWSKEDKEEKERDQNLSQLFDTPLNLSKLQNLSIKDNSQNLSRVFRNNYLVSCTQRGKKDRNIEIQRRRHNRNLSEDKKIGKKNIKVFTQLAAFFLKENRPQSKGQKEARNVNWNEVIKKISTQDTFERVDFGRNIFKKQSQKKENESNMNEMKWVKCTDMQYEEELQKIRQENALLEKGRNRKRNIFHDETIKRELKQMGIVNNIRNYTNYVNEEKKCKATLRELKHEKKQFLSNGMFEEVNFSSDEKSFNERMQKALTGKKLV